MSQLQILLGEDSTRYMIWFVLGLLALTAVLLVILILRRLFGTSFNMNSVGDKRNRPPRLGVTDFFNLDRYGRRLVIIRRDNVEHLVLIGGPNDVLVEQNIIRGIRPELPIVEPFNRPTVSSKSTEEVKESTDALFKAVQKPKAESFMNNYASLTGTEPGSALKPVQPSLSTTANASSNILSSTPLKLTPIKPASQIFEKSQLRPVQKLPLSNEQLQVNQPYPDSSLNPGLDKTAEQIENSGPDQNTVNDQDYLRVQSSQNVEMNADNQVKKSFTANFSDATKRLEEALRRSPSIPELSIKTEAENEVPADFANDKPQEQVKQSSPAIHKTDTSSKSENLVLDLEQEMARLLGRSPPKNN